MTLELGQADQTSRTLTFKVAGKVQEGQCTAAWADCKGVSLKDLAVLCGVQDEAATEVLAQLGTVGRAAFAYSTTRNTVVSPRAARTTRANRWWRPCGPGRERVWVGRVSVGLNVGLASVPLLRGQIPSALDVGLRGLGLLVAPKPVPAVRVAELNQAISATGSGAPLLPEQALAEGAAFAVDLWLPDRTRPSSVLVGAGSTSGKPTGGGPVPTVAGSGTDGGVSSLTAW
ncbi:hypothetical protein [Streptomyces axinellae]|uniref:Uncharacterized protein n=1 Tax=Streptomyces axinellae TaxID=552788 RepID=A0ABP6CG29_9ACTN